MMMMAMLPVISVEKEGGCVPRGLLRDCLPFDGGGKSVVVRDSTGRLGNQMFVVHMLAALHLKFGYKSYMGRRTGNALNTFFGNIVQHFPIAEVRTYLAISHSRALDRPVIFGLFNRCPLYRK